MRRLTLGVLCVCFLLAGPRVAKAQDKPANGAHRPPAVLVVMREWVKPGKSGTLHERTEASFIQAFARAKWPTHYLGMESLTGKSRALFFTGYDSFDAWEKDSAAAAKNAALSAAITRASDMDGTLLDGTDQMVFAYRGDLSLRDDVDLTKARFVDITSIAVKQGHEGEFEEASKMVDAAFEKANPGAHWACYQAAYGVPDGTYLFISIRNSAAEIDSDYSHNADFAKAMGDDGMKKLDEIAGRAIESSENQLFQINPNMSYVGDDLIKADPAFWKPRAATAAVATAKKTEEKPSGN